MTSLAFCRACVHQPLRASEYPCRVCLFTTSRPFPHFTPKPTTKETSSMSKSNTRIVHVTFSGYGKQYAYHTDIAGVEVGDKVVVDTPSSGLTIVTVTSVGESAEGVEKAEKWIVDRIDLAAHRARLDRIERQKVILAKLRKMEAERLQADQFAELAKTSPEAALLVEELRGMSS